MALPVLVVPGGDVPQSLRVVQAGDVVRPGCYIAELPFGLLDLRTKKLLLPLLLILRLILLSGPRRRLPLFRFAGELLGGGLRVFDVLFCFSSEVHDLSALFFHLCLVWGFLLLFGVLQFLVGREFSFPVFSAVWILKKMMGIAAGVANFSSVLPVVCL